MESEILWESEITPTLDEEGIEVVRKFPIIFLWSGLNKNCCVTYIVYKDFESQNKTEKASSH
jgi:hypothetical protein